MGQSRCQASIWPWTRCSNPNLRCLKRYQSMAEVASRSKMPADQSTAGCTVQELESTGEIIRRL